MAKNERWYPKNATSGHRSPPIAQLVEIRVRVSAGGVLNLPLPRAGRTLMSDDGAYIVDTKDERIPEQVVVICHRGADYALKGWKQHVTGKPIVVVDPGASHDMLFVPKSRCITPFIDRDYCKKPHVPCSDANHECGRCVNNPKKKQN